MIQPLHLLILVYCFVTFSKHLIFTYLKSNYGFLAPNKNVPSILTFYHVIKKSFMGFIYSVHDMLATRSSLIN
jgi:hypothetical protein